MTGKAGAAGARARQSEAKARCEAIIAEAGRRAAIVFEDAAPAERRHVEDRREGERRSNPLDPIAAMPGAWLNSLTSAERKEVAIARGLYAYFGDALAMIARHSVRANEKHNPGQPVHWSREKSADHEDCIARHSISVAIDPNSLDDGAPHIVCRAWRALAALQLWAEEKVRNEEKV